ncbi:MAG: lysophospholipid acyltransferase family protein [Pseudomonadota bacterium]
MKQKLARALLRMLGWSMEGEPPTAKRFVLIAAPHTSNWDFPYMLLYAWAFGVQVNWLAKHTLFFPGANGILRALGGIPVVRHKSQRMVDTMVDALQANEELILVIPAEGTRAFTKYWKSGFYHIARRASVPIVPSRLDYKKKSGGFGKPLHVSGSLERDMNYFRQFYRGVSGKYPDQFGPIRLAEEDRPTDSEGLAA